MEGGTNYASGAGPANVAGAANADGATNAANANRTVTSVQYNTYDLHCNTHYKRYGPDRDWYAA